MDDHARAMGCAEQEAWGREMNDGVKLKVIPHPEGKPLPDDFEFNPESLETVEIDIPMNERIKQLAEEFAMHTETMSGIVTDYVFDLEDLERFAELVIQNYASQLITDAEQARKDEREACAKLCESIDAEYEGEDVLATWCAKAIRARGNT